MISTYYLSQANLLKKTIIFKKHDYIYRFLQHATMTEAFYVEILSINIKRLKNVRLRLI